MSSDGGAVGLLMFGDSLRGIFKMGMSAFAQSISILDPSINGGFAASDISSTAAPDKIKSPHV
jgi:hypothetical protein